MTIKLVALWTAPEDREGFLADYDATHAGLARSIPGLLSFEASTSLDGKYLRMAQLAFADLESFGAAMGTEQGAALAADSDRLTAEFGNTVDVLIVEVAPS